ncbi:MAG: riboflavin synthase [Brevinematia bacterium]
MFSGIIKYTGIIVRSLNKTDGEITIKTPEVSKVVEIGGSVAVNGACLTVIRKTPDELTFFVSSETSEKSTIPKLKPDTVVNLELPSTPSSFLDGHIVLGHIDTIGQVNEIIPIGNSYKLTISIPKNFMKNLVYKGSVAVDGISLTISEINDSLRTFSVAVIPHTYENTNIKYLKPEEYVNIEFDIIGKYIERLLSTKDKPITMEKLKDFLGT